MYLIWFLAFTAAAAAGIALKKLFATPERPMLIPFSESRPMPDPRSAHELDRQEKVRAGLLKLAQEPESERLLPPAPNVGQQTHTFASQPGPQDPLASAASETKSGAGQGVNRISTWGDRRLFSEFRGILSENRSQLAPIDPDEFPLPEQELLFGRITLAVAQLLPESAARRETQRKNLTGAGYFSRASWTNLTALRFAMAFVSMVGIGILLLAASPAAEPWLLALLIVTPLLGWAIPPLVVSLKASERCIDIEHGLPDVLDMMNMAVSQGLTVPQSLKRISREISNVHPALARELQLVMQQSEVGNMPQALRNFSQRIDSPEVNSFTSLLIQSEATGTSISRSLTEYSDGIRSSLKERADARANLASFKLLFPVALLLMPSVFLFLLGPAIVELSDFFNNQAQHLQQSRRDAIQRLDQAPQLSDNRFVGQLNRPL